MYNNILLNRTKYLEEESDNEKNGLHDRLKDAEALCKLNSLRLESFRQSSDVDDSSDDWETAIIDQLLRSKKWNQLVEQSTFGKTHEWIVTDRKQVIL